MLHQIAADGFVAGSVHDARRGDERQNAAFAERIQTLDEEIVVNGLERLPSNRVVALPKDASKIRVSPKGILDVTTSK